MKSCGLFLLLVVVAGCGPGGPSRQEKTLNPRFPVIEGECAITDQWSVTLPGKFNRRTKSGDLIVWRPGLTIYVVVWNNDQNETRAEQLAGIMERISANAFEIREADEGEILRFSYRLTEHRDGKALHALYGYAIGDNGRVQTATYCEHKSDLEVARQIFSSWSESGR